MLVAKKRTKSQKQKTKEKRSTGYSYTPSGVRVQESEESLSKKTGAPAVEKKATTPIVKKGVKSSFDTQMAKLLYQDIRKTGIVTSIVFFVLLGIYAYIR